jgi:hypothetical protein
MAKILCRLGLHSWKRETVRGVGGRAGVYRCTRCGKDRYDSDAHVPPVPF